MKIEDIKPARGLLLGEILGGDYQTESGLFVVNSLKKKKPEKVRIVDVGEPTKDRRGKLIDSLAKPGDTVYFKLNAGIPFRLGNKEYLFLKPEDVVGVAD